MGLVAEGSTLGTDRLSGDADSFLDASHPFPDSGLHPWRSRSAAPSTGGQVPNVLAIPNALDVPQYPPPQRRYSEVEYQPAADVSTREERFLLIGRRFQVHEIHRNTVTKMAATT